jgi:hypothetical protein
VPRKTDDQFARQLADVLDEQAHVVSRQQALAMGLTDSAIKARLRAGLWQAGYPGTYVAHNGEIAYLTRVWSAVLYAGSGVLASFETAAYLHRLVDLPPSAVHVSVPSTRRVFGQRGLVVHLGNRVPAQEQLCSSPPRTNLEETVLDVAASKTRPDDVVAVVTNACQRRKTEASRLGAALAQRKRMPRRRLVQEVIAAVGEGVHSVLEWRYLHDVERPHGLPRAGRQMTRRRNGKREWVDVDYEEYGVIVELDGEAYHDRDQRSRDRARDRAAAVRGEFTLRYGWRDVTLGACEAAAEIADMLRARGWKGTLRPCRRCRSARFPAA